MKMKNSGQDDKKEITIF